MSEKKTPGHQKEKKKTTEIRQKQSKKLQKCWFNKTSFHIHESLELRRLHYFSF